VTALLINAIVCATQTDEFFLFASLMSVSTIVFAIMSYHYRYIDQYSPALGQQPLAATSN